MTKDMCKTVAEEEPFHCTVLHRAIQWRNEAALQTLLDAGANQKLGNREGVTPLQYAVLFGSGAMVEALLPRTTPLRREVLENDLWSEYNLVTLAVQWFMNSDYIPEWVCQKNHPLRPPDMFQQRAANVDLVLSVTRGQWAPADLEQWLQEAEEPHVREVVDVVHGHLRFTDLRRAWILVVACNGWRRW